MVVSASLVYMCTAGSRTGTRVTMGTRLRAVGRLRKEGCGEYKKSNPIVTDRVSLATQYDDIAAGISLSQAPVCVLHPYDALHLPRAPLRLGVRSPREQEHDEHWISPSPSLAQAAARPPQVLQLSKYQPREL